MNKCMWLSDEFSHICCCADNTTYCADACPFQVKPDERQCRFYEELAGPEKRSKSPGKKRGSILKMGGGEKA